MKRIVLSFISFSFIFFSVFTYAEEKITFYHNDVLGSPVAASDIDGKLLWKEEYAPYGKRRLTQQSLNHRGYTSHVEDSNTSLVYMQARYYDPLIGRFYGIDKAGVIPGKQHSFNRYSYANNNPYRYIDPNGEVGIIPILLGALTVVGVVSFAAFSDYANAPGEGDAIQEKSALEMGLTALGGATGRILTTAKVGRQAINTGDNIVYQSVNSQGKVVYVGITNNLERRAGEHLGQKGISIDAIPGLTNLSRADAHAVEQVLIELHGLGKNGGTLLNRINSIAQTNPIYAQSLQRGTELLQQVGYPGF